MVKKLYKKSAKLTVTGLGLAVGTNMLSSFHNTGNAQNAMGRMSSALPVAGKMYAAGSVMNSLKGFQKSTKKLRK